jgi:hypothetical protein
VTGFIEPVLHCPVFIYKNYSIFHHGPLEDGNKKMFTKDNSIIFLEVCLLHNSWALVHGKGQIGCSLALVKQKSKLAFTLSLVSHF